MQQSGSGGVSQKNNNNSPRSHMQEMIRRQKKYSTVDKSTVDVASMRPAATNSNFFNTYAVMDEYGNHSTSGRQKSLGPAGINGHKHVPKLAATNQTDFKIFSK